MFPIPEFEVEQDLVFILMPFDEEFNAIYKECITGAVCEKNFRCLRADEIFSNKPIMEDVWNYINRARLIIADLTGRNPNVLYEVGICHTLGKDVIFITQSIRDIPFDIRHLRVITYQNTPDGLENCKEKLSKTIDSVFKP